MDINNVFNGGGDQLQADAEKGTVLAVLLDDKLHPRALEGGAELSDLWALKVLQSLRRAKNGILDITAHSFPQKRPCFQPTPAGRPPNREPNNVGRGWRRRTARPG